MFMVSTTPFRLFIDATKFGTGDDARRLELTGGTGPIIRVTPDELHIRDSSFFEEFYGKNVHLDKEGWDKRFGTEGGVLTTVHAATHKRRRAALSPMYVHPNMLPFT